MWRLRAKAAVQNFTQSREKLERPGPHSYSSWLLIARSTPVDFHGIVGATLVSSLQPNALAGFSALDVCQPCRELSFCLDANEARGVLAISFGIQALEHDFPGDHRTVYGFEQLLKR